MGEGRAAASWLVAGGEPGAAVLVGRGRELAELTALAESAAEGRGGVAVLVGEAGVGKSRLVQEVLADCVARGFSVFAAVADAVDRHRPFGIVVDALGDAHDDARAWGEARRLLDGELRDGAGGLGLEWRIAGLLVQVVEEACSEGPVVVVLDDLQWADASSLMAVKGLARLAQSQPLLVLCALRGYPAGGALRALLASLDYLRAHRFALQGLEPGDAAELAGVLAGAPVGDSVREVLAEAGGNPFYVSELLACLLREGGAKPSPDGVLELLAGGLPPSLGLTVLDELRFMPEETLDVLRAGAVAGRVFAVSEVALIVPSSVADVAGALDPALRAGIVIADGERLAFRHDLVREAIYEDLTPAVRSGLHRYMATRLAESGASAERVAAQLMLGAEPGDGEAIGWLRGAAAEVRASSPAIAADLLKRALELSEGTGPARMGVLVDLVRPLLWTGQAALAEQVCAEALVSDSPPGEEPLFWMGLVNSRILQGRFGQARETAEKAGACVTLTASDRDHLSSARALCALYSGDPQGVELARELVASAPRSIPKGIAQEVLAQWELFTGRADRALDAYALVDSMREPAELESRIWQSSGIRVRMWEAVALLDLDRIDEAVAVLDQEVAAKLAVPALPHAFLAACHYHAGRFDDAVRNCDAAVVAADASGSFTPASAFALAAVIALRQGQLDDAGRLLERAEQAGTPAEAAGDTIARWVRTLWLAATDEHERAADAAAEALQAYMRAGFASYIAWHAPDFVRVALAVGRRDQAEQAAHAAGQVAAQLPVASRRAAELRARGLLSADAGLLTQSVDAAREAGRPVDLAATLCDTAASLARSGRSEQARPLSTEALKLLSALGADGDQRQARKLLRAAGLAISARAKHTIGKDGWDSLTEGERRVVALAAEGRSNPEIANALYLSRRTVGWHLSNIFRKVGVSSRGELAAEALRRHLA